MMPVVRKQVLTWVWICHIVLLLSSMGGPTLVQHV